MTHVFYNDDLRSCFLAAPTLPTLLMKLFKIVECANLSRKHRGNSCSMLHDNLVRDILVHVSGTANLWESITHPLQLLVW